MAAGIGAIGSIAGGLIQGSSAKSAADTQAAAADRASQVQLDMFNRTRADVQPWITGGGLALNSLEQALGLVAPGGVGTAGTPGGMTGGTPAVPGTPGQVGGGYTLVPPSAGDDPNGAPRNPMNLLMGPDGRMVMAWPDGTPQATIQQWMQQNGIPMTGGTPGTPAVPGTPVAAPGGGGSMAGTPYAGFVGSPGYQFQLNQGMGAIQNSAAARGGINSGTTLKALQKFGTGLANQDWYNYLGQLSGLSGTGANAAGGFAGVSAGVGGQVGSNIIGAGNAAAAGQVGLGNAINSGLSNLAPNLQDLWLNQGGVPSGIPVASPGSWGSSQPWDAFY